MAPNFDSPVQTQMAVSVLNRTLSNDCHGNPRSEGKTSGRRRVFVQTDTGLVLGLELERGDNVHTVKRRLQLALNMPTEESSLSLGDVVLKNDLSVVRNDSPLLLTRSFLQRSSSTPCLSPIGNDLQQSGDHSDFIEILCSNNCTEIKLLVKDAVKGIKKAIDPIAVHRGLGGAYFFRNISGANIAIVKPTDEEPFAPNNPKGFIGKALGQPGLKRSVRVGETGFREVAAYLLDYDNFANVPPTALVKITHPVFHLNEDISSEGSIKASCRKINAASKIASLQKYIPHDFDASDHGTSSFPVTVVHRIGILDVRIFNTDRHAGNLLVRKIDGNAGSFGAVMELIPIDHGFCLPESLEDPYFEWIHWPQSSIPFSEEELKYIRKLDPFRDSEMLRMELPMIRESCLRVLVLSTIFLKEATAFGLCLAEIGEMMSREFSGMEEEPSELEVICIEARRLVAERETFSPKCDSPDDEGIQFDLDYEDNDALMQETSPVSHCVYRGGISRNLLSKLEESVEDEDELEDENEDETLEKANFLPPFEARHIPDVSKLSMSLKGVSIARKSQRYLAGFPKSSLSKSKTSKGDDSSRFKGGEYRSANEQLPASVSFVKLSDMGEAEWTAFLEKFQELLPGAFRGRKCSAAARMRQRFGTSCQF